MFKVVSAGNPEVEISPNHMFLKSVLQGLQYMGHGSAAR
jgi:hypothetical protein